MKLEKIKVRLTFTEEVLGTMPGDPEITKTYVISKGPDGKKQEEEIANLPAEEALEKKTTYFAKDEKGRFFWDYQVKGFLKEAIGVLVEAGDAKNLTKWTFKKAVDNMIFVGPRKIHLNHTGEPGMCERSLRVDTPQGERIALARSESLPIGTTMELEIGYVVSTNAKAKSKDINAELIMSALAYGELKGLAQWRNSGKGRFTTEIIKG